MNDSPHTDNSRGSEMMSVIEAVKDAALAQDDEAFLALLHDDIVYHYHVSSRPLVGKEWVLKFLRKYREITRDVTWRIDRWAEGDDFVLVEGYEQYFDTRTGQTIAHPYAGIFEFRDGLIVGWRDYFEMNQVKQEDAA